MRVFGWLADAAGCGWYRLILPLGALRDLGLAQTGCHRRMMINDDGGDGGLALDHDVVIAQRTFMPGPTQVWQRLAHTENRPAMVYEVDDDLFHVEPDNPSYETFSNQGVQLRMRKNIEVADLVTVSTQPLAEELRQYNPNVVVLPNCIPSRLLQWRRGRYPDRFTFGWSGSPTHDKDWAEAARGVADAFRTVSHAEIHTIGATPSTFPKDVPHRATGWVANISALYHVIDWDVALAPLADTRFNRSKSDLRLLEAAVLGTPAIASDVEPYQIAHTIGLVARTPTQWRNAVHHMMNRPEHRAELAGLARDWAATRTIEGNAHLWLAAYEQAVKIRG